MTDVKDSELTQAFADHQSEAAFGQIVQRHINLVYSVALRFTGHPEDARDVTQAVFIILSRKASGLRQRVTLTGWLYETTRLTARQFLRTKARQFARDQEAHMLSRLNEPDTNAVWQQLAPQLEEAMSRLNESERALLALRYFENKTGQETAALLGIRADAAHKRTARAVEKLRGWFTKRGVTLTATVLTAAISANSVQAAPLGLAATVTGTAVKGVAISGSTLILTKGALKVMAWTKMKTTIAVGVGVLIAAGTVWSFMDDYLQDENLNNFENAPPMVMIQKTHFLRSTFATQGKRYSNKAVGRNIPLSFALGDAYGFLPARIVFPADMPGTKVDYIITTTNQPWEKFQAEIKKQFGFVGRVETIETNVLLVRLGADGATKLKISPWPKSIAQGEIDQSRFVDMRTQPLSSLTSFLENEMGRPVIDQTGLTNFFDIVLEWNRKQYIAARQGSAASRTLLIQTIHDQTGLELISTNMPIEMLVVEKVK